MSKLFSCILGACLFLGGSIELANGQFHCDSRSYYNNPAPIWQQMGTINPYHRPGARPVWRVYSNVPAVPNYRSRELVSSIPWALIPTNPPNNSSSTNTWVADTIIPATENGGPAPSRNAITSGTFHESLDPVAAIPGTLIVDGNADVALELNELDLDNQNSPSDETLMAPDDADIQENEADTELELELAELKDVLALTKSQNLELLSEVERLKKMLEKQIVKTMRSGENEPEADTKANTKQRIEEAKSKVKKELAWEIANLRKTAERAKNELSKTKKQAERKQQQLLDRLAAVEAKLKNAVAQKDHGHANHKHESGHAAPENEPRNGKALSLADMAKIKRRQRAETESQQQGKPVDKSAKPDYEMNRQIERAVGKIKRRFATKIERAKESNASEDDFKRLKSEMKIQMEKMEERIRNRFKNRANQKK